MRRIFEGGKLVRYGAKTVPIGGWYSIPQTYMDGCLIIGDSASLLNSQRLKGIHMAIKSGMLAAETILDALRAGDSSAAKLSAFPRKMEESWIAKELRAVRNFHQSFQHGLWLGLAQTAVQYVTGGRGLVDPMRMPAGYTEYHKLDGAAQVRRPRVFRATACSPLIASPTSIIPALATKRISPATFTSSIPASASAAASPNTEIPASISVPRRFTKWWKKKAGGA